MLRAVRVFAPVVVAVGLMVGPWSLPAGVAADEPFLRGPHPFRKDNALSLGAGYGLASDFRGVSAAVGYGYQLAGSLWLDLRFDLLDAANELPRPSLPCEGCAEVATFADVLAGLRYKLQTDIPLVPYFGAVVGPVFLFNHGADGAVGVALRASAGAKYFLYEWLGLGLELGLMIGGALVDETAGLSGFVRMVDLGLGAEVQF
jgi:hypothetical protein